MNECPGKALNLKETRYFNWKLSVLYEAELQNFFLLVITSQRVGRSGHVATAGETEVKHSGRYAPGNATTLHVYIE